MRFVTAFLVTAALAALTGAAHARADALEGTWSGAGTVRLNSGAEERVRCRVSYRKDIGRTYVLNASCAHTSGTFKQDGRVVDLGGNRYTGRLYNPQYSVSGQVSISVRGARQTVHVSSPKGKGTLSLSRR